MTGNEGGGLYTGPRAEWVAQTACERVVQNRRFHGVMLNGFAVFNAPRIPPREMLAGGFAVPTLDDLRFPQWEGFPQREGEEPS